MRINQLLILKDGGVTLIQRTTALSPFHCHLKFASNCTEVRTCSVQLETLFVSYSVHAFHFILSQLIKISALASERGFPGEEFSHSAVFNSVC